MRLVTLCISFLLTEAWSASAVALPLTGWGVKAGYTSATQVWEHDVLSSENFSMTPGVHVGVFTEWFGHGALSMLIGIQYEQKGTRFETAPPDFLPPGTGRSFSGESRLDYLSIPILAKLRAPARTLSPYVVAGPRLDVFVGYADDDDHLVWGVEDDFDDVVLGVSGGLGIEHVFGTSHVALIEFIYNHDPFWLYEFRSGLTGNEQKVKNESFNVSVGIGF